jgi:hypothetical protein
LEEHTASIFRAEEYAREETRWQADQKWRQYFPSKYRAVSELHDITSQKTILFIVTAVRNSYPA